MNNQLEKWRKELIEKVPKNQEIKLLWYWQNYSANSNDYDEDYTIDEYGKLDEEYCFIGTIEEFFKWEDENGYDMWNEDFTVDELEKADYILINQVWDNDIGYSQECAKNIKKIGVRQRA